MRRHVTATAPIIVLIALLAFSLGGAIFRTQVTVTPSPMASDTPTASVQPTNTSTPQQATAGGADESWKMWAAIISATIAFLGFLAASLWKFYHARIAIFEERIASLKTQLESKDEQIHTLKQMIEMKDHQIEQQELEMQKREEHLKREKELIDDKLAYLEHRRRELREEAQVPDRTIKISKERAKAEVDSGVAKQLKEVAESLEELDKKTGVVIALNSDEYLRRGNESYRLDDFEDAVANYTKAIELRSDFSSAYNNRGVAYDALGQDEKAIADYEKAIELRPDYADAYNNRGATYYRMAKHKEAIADYTQVLKLRPNDADAYYNRSLAYRAVGQDEKAEADHAQAVKLDPSLEKEL